VPIGNHNGSKLADTFLLVKNLTRAEIGNL